MWKAQGKPGTVFEPAPSILQLSWRLARNVTLLRGRGMGLEIALAGRDLTEAFEELEARLGERPGFYRGTSATANFGARAPAEEEVERLRSLLDSAGIRAFFDHPRRGGAPRSRAGAAARDASGPRGSALRFRAVPGSRFCGRPNRHCRAPQTGREQRPQAPRPGSRAGRSGPRFAGRGSRSGDALSRRNAARRPSASPCG